VALEIIGMYGLLAGGTQDALAQIDIPQDGVLRAVDWDMSANLDADAEFVRAELSFIATGQATQNDIRGRITSIGTIATVLTAVGVNHVSIQKFVGPFELMVAGGERLYINASSTAGVDGDIRLNLHFDGGATVTRRSARR